jgi:hypothetical protein
MINILFGNAFNSYFLKQIIRIFKYFEIFYQSFKTKAELVVLMVSEVLFN